MDFWKSAIAGSNLSAKFRENYVHHLQSAIDDQIKSSVGALEEPKRIWQESVDLWTFLAPKHPTSKNINDHLDEAQKMAQLLTLPRSQISKQKVEINGI